MNKELVKLAKSKGFEGIFEKEWTHNSKEPIRYYLWMCELQKWLRDRKILLEVCPIDNWESWCWSISLEGLECPFNQVPWNEFEYKSHDEALEQGLFMALAEIRTDLHIKIYNE